MTLEQAIEHCKEKAEELKAKVPYKVFGDEWTQEDKECMECANEHEQLASWLEELKALRHTVSLLKFNIHALNELVKESEADK